MVNGLVIAHGTSDVNTEEALSDHLDLLCRCGAGQYMEGWLLDTLHMNLTSAVAPEFWAGLKLQDGEEVQERRRARVLLQAFRTLLARLEPSLGEIIDLVLYNRDCLPSLYL